MRKTIFVLLASKTAYENAVREQRLRTEISQAKRENAHYLQSVDKSKTVSAIVEKKKRTGKPLKPVDHQVRVREESEV